jgi:hypothetical protein
VNTSNVIQKNVAQENDGLDLSDETTTVLMTSTQ